MLIVKGAKPSPFARKVIITLEEKGIPYELENLAPIPKTPELLAMNPLGKIPILQDGDDHIPDSSVIIAYLERIHPTPSVYPEDPKEYARALFLEELADTRIVDVLGGIFFERFIKARLFQQEPDAEKVDAILANDLPPLLDLLESLVPEGRSTLLPRFSVADIAWGCQLMSLQLCDVEVDAGRAPKLAAYADSILSRPSFKAAAPEVG